MKYRKVKRKEPQIKPVETPTIEEFVEVIDKVLSTDKIYTIPYYREARDIISECTLTGQISLNNAKLLVEIYNHLFQTMESANCQECVKKVYHNLKKWLEKQDGK